MTVSVNNNASGGGAATFEVGQMALFAFPPADASWVKTGYSQIANDTWSTGYAFPNNFTPFTCTSAVDSQGTPHCLATDGTTPRLLHFIGDVVNRVWVEQTSIHPVPATVWALYGAPAFTWLPNGKMILVCPIDQNQNPTSTALLYTPGQGWAVIGNFPVAMTPPRGFTFPNGQAVFVGGNVAGSSVSTVYTYTEATGFVQARNAPYAADAPAIGLLPSGKALLFGGVARPAGTRLANCYSMSQDGAGDFIYSPFTFYGAGRSDVVPIGTPDGLRLYGGYTYMPTTEVWDFHEAAGQFSQGPSSPSAIFSHGVQLPDASVLFIPETAQSIANQQVASSALRGAVKPFYYYKAK